MNFNCSDTEQPYTPSVLHGFPVISSSLAWLIEQAKYDGIQKAAHSFIALVMASDASKNREEFLITGALEAESSLGS